MHSFDHLIHSLRFFTGQFFKRMHCSNNRFPTQIYIINVDKQWLLRNNHHGPWLNKYDQRKSSWTFTKSFFDHCFFSFKLHWNRPHCRIEAQFSVLVNGITLSRVYTSDTVQCNIHRGSARKTLHNVTVSASQGEHEWSLKFETVTSHRSDNTYDWQF